MGKQKVQEPAAVSDPLLNILAADMMNHGLAIGLEVKAIWQSLADESRVKHGTRLEDFKPLMQAAVRRLIKLHEDGNVIELGYGLDDLLDSLSSVRVHATIARPAASSPVPDYDPETDGDYNVWLARHTID